MFRTTQSLIRRLGRLISFLHLAAVTLFALEPHHRLKIVGVESQITVELIDQGQLLAAHQALIAHVPPHHSVVLLLHKTVVVLAVRPRAGESYALLLTIPEQMVVDEL